MFEVQVLSDGVNFALQGIATQSSTRNGDEIRFAAAHAIDDDTATFSHTETGAGAWWELDLQASIGIQSVKILNRYCGGASDTTSECLCRLSNATLELYDVSNNLVDTRYLGDTCGITTVLQEFTSCKNGFLLEDASCSVGLFL
jgi:hypothetical protein